MVKPTLLLALYEYLLLTKTLTDVKHYSFQHGHKNSIVIAKLLLTNLFLNYEYFMAFCPIHVTGTQILYLGMQ